MRPVTLPPATWLAVVVTLAVLVQEQFPVSEYWWSPGVVIALGAAAKLIEVYWPESKQESARGYLWTGRAWKFWIGG